ncbi:MAG: PKD domain-containing protein [Candidatus Bipolaricaulota bacterium]
MATLLLGGCFLLPNTAPLAVLDAEPLDGVAPLTVEFRATRSYDPDGSIRRYAWDFGDGEKATGATVDHVYAQAGTHDVTLTVTDRRGARSTASVTIRVRATNELPVAAFSVAPSTAFPQQAVRFDAGASYDADGEIVSYVWRFGDGTSANGRTVSHAYGDVGTYTVTLTVADNDGGERAATASLVVSTEIDTTRTLSRRYEWTYDGQIQTCHLEIPVDLYTYYRSQPRTAWASRDYDEYVLDELDDAYLEEVTQEILSGSTGDRHEQLENALFFVQNCIEYVYDPRWYEYPRYPVETLVEEGGDCEDTAILYTSLVRTLGYGALMVAVDTDGNGYADHMVAWVPVETGFVSAHPDRSFWDYDGQTYAFAETAVEGGYLELGIDPWGLSAGDIETIYDVSRVDRAPAARRLIPQPRP